MLLKEITQSQINFVTPSDDEEHEEVVYQLESDAEQHFLPDWVRNAYQDLQHEKLYRLTSRREGDIVNITPEEQKNIGNTGDSWEDSHWKPESVERVPKMFASGQPITMPTLLINKQTSEKWLVGGHHRLTYNAQKLGNATPCWGIFV